MKQDSRMVINFKQFRDTKIFESIIKNLRSYDDIQEYCFISNYEMIYEKPVIDSIDIGDVIATILEYPTESELVAIQFPPEWKVGEIECWNDGKCPFV